MTISHQRLDKFISKHCHINRKAVKLMLAQKRVLVNGELAVNVDQIVHKFTQIMLDGQLIQNEQPVYIMLNKPIGVVSSTKAGNANERLRKKNPSEVQAYPTVIDLLTRQDKTQLHLVGRLDLNTSGLMLLTNDSRWSKQITSPTSKVEKHYRVTLQKKLSADYVSAFAEGLYLTSEKVTTQPARLVIVSDYVADVWLTEGRYHQIKKMFGCFSNNVMALHRSAIGDLTLDKNLPEGSSRELTAEEVAYFQFTPRG